jgi:hypothetical protein
MTLGNSLADVIINLDPLTGSRVRLEQSGRSTSPAVENNESMLFYCKFTIILFSNIIGERYPKVDMGSRFVRAKGKA